MLELSFCFLDIWRRLNPASQATPPNTRPTACSLSHVTATTTSLSYIASMKTTRLYKSLRKMRRFSESGIPFSITYISYNSTDAISAGVVTKKKVMLRTGLSTKKHKKGRVLIGYKDYDTGKYGWFYLPLLLKVNNTDIYD